MAVPNTNHVGGEYPIHSDRPLGSLLAKSPSPLIQHPEHHLVIPTALRIA